MKRNSMMNTLAFKFQQLVTPQHLNTYWPRFKAFIYVIDNDNDYLTPSKTNAVNTYTIILFEGFRTAIVDTLLSLQFNET